MNIIALLKTAIGFIVNPKNRWIIFIAIGFVVGFWLAWHLKKCACPELVSTSTVTVIDTIRITDTISAQLTADNATVSHRIVPMFHKELKPMFRDTDTVKVPIPYAVHDTVIKTYETQNCYGFKVWLNEKTKKAIVSDKKPDSLYCAYAEFRECSIIFPENKPGDLYGEMNFVPGAFVRETKETTNNFVIKLPFYKNKWFYGTLVFSGVTAYLVYDKLKRR